MNLPPPPMNATERLPKQHYSPVPFYYVIVMCLTMECEEQWTWTEEIRLCYITYLLQDDLMILGQIFNIIS